MSEGARILIGGTGMPLGQSICRAAQLSPRKHEIHNHDVDPDVKHIFPDLFFWNSPHMKEGRFVNDLIEYVNDNRIEVIFPGSEKEIAMLLQNNKQIVQAKTSAVFALCSEESWSKAGDKFNLVQTLKLVGLPYPRTILFNKSWDDSLGFFRTHHQKCIVKSRRAGQPITVINETHLRYLFESYPDAVLQEFLGVETDSEMTVGVFCAKEYGVVSSIAFLRKLKYGLTWRASPMIDERFNEQIDILCKEIGAQGSVNVQARFHSGEWVIHDVNLRPSSSTIFRALAGWNEVDMAIDYFLHNSIPEKKSVVALGRGIRFFEERWINE